MLRCMFSCLGLIACRVLSHSDCRLYWTCIQHQVLLSHQNLAVRPALFCMCRVVGQEQELSCLVCWLTICSVVLQNKAEQLHSREAVFGDPKIVQKEADRNAHFLRQVSTSH